MSSSDPSPAAAAAASSSASSASSPSPSPPSHPHSSSASQSPPRKRVRSSAATRHFATVMIADGGNSGGPTNSSPPPSAAAAAESSNSGNSTKAGRAKMKLKNSGGSNAARQRSRGSGGGDHDSQDGLSDEECDGLQQEVPRERGRQVVRKVPRRKEQLSKTDQEVVRLIGQHLTNIGLRTSAEVLMEEAGCRLDQPTAGLFKKFVMHGDWHQAVKTLDDLKDHLEHPNNLVEMKFLLLEQKYLEFLAQRNRIEALKVLQNELTPLKHNQSRTHELSTYLMLSKSEDISRVTRPAKESNQVSRSQLMDRLQTFLPASIMLPPRRLTTLLQQAAEFQADRCLFHKGGGVPAAGTPSGARLGNTECSPSSSRGLDSSYLSVDHCCSKEDFPCETIQVLSDHCEEVWYCRFSPDGLKLATGSKDMTVIIWDFDPETLALRHSRTLERHSHGISYFAWSPDSTRLAVCGPEDCDEVCLWNVETGMVDGKISHSTEDSLTTVSWSPCGSKVACGGNRGNFYQCDTKGTVNDSWEGVRVQCLAYRKDGKSILAADTHHRIRSYNFEDLTDFSVLQEDHGIMSFTLDDSDRYALLNIANQGLHLWDVEDRTLVRKFKGITQGFYAIYSCFGGAGGPDGEQNFVASGSEDNKVYLYHVRREEPIAVLPGHSRTVNCVTWNPVHPCVLVSASDDGTVRVWGPTEQYREKRRQQRMQQQQQKQQQNGCVNGEGAGGEGEDAAAENGDASNNHSNGVS